MSSPCSSTLSASCLTNLLERHEELNQCPCWCHNGYSPPCYDCAEVVCHKKTHELSSQDTAPSAPPLTHDPGTPAPVQDLIDNHSTSSDNNNSDVNLNNNTWPAMYENRTSGQRSHRSSLRPRHPRSAGMTSLPLGGSSQVQGSSNMSRSRASVASMFPDTLYRLDSISRPGDAGRRYSYSRSRRLGSPVNLSSPGNLNRSGNMDILNRTMGWQGSRVSDLLLPTAIGTTARDTVSPDAAKWPVSRYTVYPGADVTSLSPSDPEDHETTVPSSSMDATEIADSPDIDLPRSSFQGDSEGAGSPSAAEQDLSSVGRSHNELLPDSVGSPSERVGDVDMDEEEVEGEDSVISSEARGRRLIEETLYPTEISGRTKPFLLWKLNL